MKGKKLVALLAAGTMVFSPAGMALGTPLGGVFASAVSAAEADEYLYYNEDTGAFEARDIPTTAVSVTANDTRWTEGWYVVDQDITIGSEDAASRVFVDGDVHLVLKDGCDLTVNGGIRVASGDSFTVYAQSTEKEKMGTLTAVELNGNHAAIGGNSNESAGKISLNGGIITVTCLVNSFGAGIGGGNGHDGGEISINGGVVNVYPGSAGSGAGIGGGFQGGSGQIQINNGEITIETSNAESNFGRAGAGIGSGSATSSNTDGSIVINSGTIKVCHNKTEKYGSQSSGAAIGAGAGSNIGNIVINGGTINVSEYAVGIGGNSTVNSNLTGHITINNGEIVARGSSIGIGTNSKSEVNILITNGNVQASGDTGIGGGNKTTIKITGGNIQASATGSGAGIGGLGSFSGRVSLPNIEINGGTIIAKGANIVRTSSGSSPGESAVGAGIGGGALSFSDGDTGTITITGGDITAIGGKKNYWTGGAGIGAGSSGNSGKIVISGGTIEATGYDGAAAIGSGEGVDSNTIVISGGSVTAAAISENTNFGPGAAIGGGYLANSGTVYVSGGVVKATGGKGDQNFPPSAGIGAGSNGTSGNIVISGGTITANGGSGNGYYNDAPAIGSYDGTSGSFSTVLPENGISTLGLLDDASSSRSGNAVVFANGYGSIDRPISDISQQDSWGGLFFLNGEGMMLGKTVKPTDNVIIPAGYSFTINQLQTLDLTDAYMSLWENSKIYNNGTIINPNNHLLQINGGEVVNPDPENPPADLTGLSDLVEEAKAAIASGQYTEESLKELETLIETVENAETLTDEQVKTCISQIQTAMNALKKPVDISGLDQVISAFESRTDLDQYTDESVKAVNDLIAEYQSKTGLTQDEIDEYLSKIQAAIDGLRYEIDTTAIDREIRKFNEMTLTNYTAESVKAVRDVIDEYTRAVAAGENLSQNDVDQYLARIQEKVAALEWTSGEHYGGVYDKIRELIQQAYDMLNSGTHYLEDAVAAMNKVIQRAQQVLKIPDLDYRSEEAEIIVYLEDAIDNLENSIDNYYGLDMSAYTNLVRQAEQLEELGYHGPAYNDLWRMINNLPTHFADQAAVDAYVAQMDALLQQAIEENTTVPGGDVSDSVLVQSMIDYFQRIAASGDYTEASIHRVQALINSIPDTLTDEQARYYADLIYDAVMAMEPKGSSDPVYIEVPVSSGSSSTGSSSASSTQTGWVHNTNGSVYYKNGKVLTGWQAIDGDRYYFSKQGFMQTGWQVIDGSYYYFSANGVMLTGWQKYDTAWYYLDPDTGKMVADGLYEIDGKTYYFYDWGGMAYNFWYQTESGWYFFGGDGAMKKAGWIQWDGNYYYLTASGRMAVNTTTPDGYYVNANGIWNG